MIRTPKKRRPLMLWLGIALCLLVGLLLVAFVVGSFLPRDHVARMAIELHAPPERVYALVADFGGTARWREGVSGVELLAPSGGHVRFVETSKHGKITFEVVSQEPPHRQVVRIVDEGQPFGGTWTWEIEGAGPGSRLAVTEEGFVKNPLFRVMSKLFFSPTATMNAYLRDLARELGESALPREVGTR